MAGLSSLKLLLLWAGIISLGSSAWTLECSYTVKPIKYGLQINILSSTTGTFNISMNEEGRSKGKFTLPVSLSSENIVRDIKLLKPCTKYEHSVTFIIEPGEKILCNRTEDKTMTLEMSEQDVNVSNCNPGYVCYESDWNVGSSISGRAKYCNHTSCVKLGDNDICSDFTTNFKSRNCENSSFTITTSITAGFLDENEILKSVSNELPPKIESQLPPNCKNLSIDYTCSEPGKQTEPKTLSQLEPFTDYSCVGHIKDNDITIKHTPAITFRMDCDLEIQRQTSNTNTSIELSWTTTSQKCQHILPKLEKFSYACTCSPSNQKHRANKITDGGTCKFTGLQPYTDYVCNIQPTYNNKDVSKSVKENVTTDVGIPEDISPQALTVTVVQRNMIRVTCDYNNKHVNGPQTEYIARLFYRGYTRELFKYTNRQCDFEFKDLSYFTSYTVQVSVFNGRFESSRPATKYVDTLLPEDISPQALTVTVVQRNMIRVTCDYNKRVYGPRTEYTARLFNKGDTRELFKYTNGTCDFEFKDLSYSTSYTVQVSVSNERFESSATKDVDTLLPEDISPQALTVTVVQRNMIRVTCDYKHVYGPQTEYTARLFYRGDTRELFKYTNRQCDFEFKDLSYFTSYTVQVSVSNERFKSSATKDVDTLYNDKAVLGFLIFLTILLSVLLLVGLYKTYILRRKKSYDVREDLMLQLAANTF